MENYDNEIFGFGNKSNEELEQSNNFNYDSISGLGQSDYENEDLFSTEVDNNQELNNGINDFRIGDTSNNTQVENQNNLGANYSEDYLENVVPTMDDSFITDNDINSVESENFQVNELPKEESQEILPPLDEVQNSEIENAEQPNPTNILFADESESSETEMPPMDSQQLEEQSMPSMEAQPLETQEPLTNEEEKNELDEMPYAEEYKVEENVSEPQLDTTTNTQEENSNENITLSETPIDELNKLTEYNEEKIESADISDLFNKVSVNFKDASDIFRKNTDLKKKIDTRFEELKKLQSEIENSRKNEKDEINKYKEEVLEKLTEKKEEIEKRLNLLKETQAKLEKEKQEFEDYKRKEQENIRQIQKEVQAAYDDRREELNHIEDVLRKQKDVLDEERNQLSLDKIQYESDKNELANNLLKFNDLVNSFTSGVEDIKVLDNSVGSKNNP